MASPTDSPVVSALLFCAFLAMVITAISNLWLLGFVVGLILVAAATLLSGRK